MYPDTLTLLGGGGGGGGVLSPMQNHKYWMSVYMDVTLTVARGFEEKGGWYGGVHIQRNKLRVGIKDTKWVVLGGVGGWGALWWTSPLWTCPSSPDARD